MGRVLLDAGIVIRIAYVHDLSCARIASVVEGLDKEGWELCLAPQAIREAMNALTRPAEVGGYGLECEPALRSLENVEESFTLLPDNPNVFRRWQALVAKYGIVGKSVHDVNVVASALAHGATHLLTLNERDFRRYAEVETITL